MVKPDRVRWRRRRAFALPNVEADMMMITTGRNKRRFASVTLLQLQPEHAAVKRECAFEIGNLQMHMADACRGINWLAHDVSLLVKFNKDTKSLTGSDILT